MDTKNYLVGDSPYNSAVALKYRDGDYSLEYNPPSVPFLPSDTKHTVLEGETLQNIAFAVYGDSGKWYLIAEANQIIDPFKEVIPGRILRIPSYGG